MNELTKLTPKQQRFADEYLVSLNATQAAIRAGYSQKTAEVIASENLTKPNISAYIEKCLQEKSDKLVARSDEVLETLTRVSRREELESVVVVVRTRKSYYDENGKKIIEETETPTIVEIPTKVSDAIRASELLGKYHKLFSDKASIDVALPVFIYGADELE